MKGSGNGHSSGAKAQGNPTHIRSAEPGAPMVERMGSVEKAVDGCSEVEVALGEASGVMRYEG
jgi:hypothetical protein